MKLVLSHSAQKDLDKLPDDIALKISTKLYELETNPYLYGAEKLKANKGYRIRIGDYRAVYMIDKAAKIVVIVKVKHRREVYR